MASAAPLSAQIQDASMTTPWNTTFGGPDFDRGWSIHAVEDGVVLAGWTASYGAGNADGWMLRLDDSGQELWNHTYGREGNDRIVAMEPTPDGYILAGYTTSYGARFTDLWLVRTDKQGRELWNQTYGGIDYDQGWAICTVDDGFAVTGFTASYGALNSNLWILRIDGQGRELWNITFGGRACETGFAIEAIDDGFAVAGYYESCGGPYDLWILATDGDGNERWNRTYGGEGVEVARSMIVTDDGFALTGWTSTYGAGNRDCWLLITDSQGNEVTRRTYGGPGNDGGFSLAATEEGYAIAGWTASYGSGGQDLWLFSTDADGDLQWEYHAGGPGNDVAYGMIHVDNRFLMIGITESYGAGRDDLWLLSLDDPQVSITPGGGIGMTIQVSSSGQEEINGAWTVSFDGWILPLEASGVIADLPPGGSTRVAVPTFGFGSVTAMITFGDVQRRAAFVSLGPILVPVG